LLAEGNHFVPATATTAAVEELVRAIYRLGAVRREIAHHALAELGSQGFTALSIVYSEGPVRISDVAAHLGIDLSVASRQVAALEAAGYVRRETDPDDRRVHRVAVTDAGTRVLGESHRRMVDAFATALAGWSEGEIAALAGGLNRLRDDFARGAETEPREETAR
jgi:DNA-binding MarR family transcriptional regulator